MLIFDIRRDNSHDGFIAAVNRGLDSVPGNTYLARFGHVGSSRWWECFDRGELPVKVLSGVVTFAGLRSDLFEEEEDVIEFSCNSRSVSNQTDHQESTATLHTVGNANSVGDRIIAYDRSDHWAAHTIRVGDRVEIVRTQAEVLTPSGSLHYLIDVRAEWFRASGDQSLD